MEAGAVSNCFAPIAQPLQGWVTGVGAVQGQSDAPKKGECPLISIASLKKKSVKDSAWALGNGIFRIYYCLMRVSRISQYFAPVGC